MSSSSSPIKEGYADNCNMACKAPIPPSPLQDVQNIQTGCPNCPLIYAVRDERTAYDKYWLRFYNSKAAATDYDLLKLQFAA